MISKQPIQTSLWDDEMNAAKLAEESADKRNTPLSPVPDGPGHWKCPRCRAIVNKHTPERCNECGQLMDRRALR